MDLKHNVAEQKEYLERNIEQLNTVVSAILGYQTELEVVEKTSGKTTYFKVADNRNIRGKCGVMAKAFKEVTIGNFAMWWCDNGVCIDLHFYYEHIDGGTNCAEFCVIDIIDDLVTIRER